MTKDQILTDKTYYRTDNAMCLDNCPNIKPYVRRTKIGSVVCDDCSEQIKNDDKENYVICKYINRKKYDKYHSYEQRWIRFIILIKKYFKSCH